MSYEPHFLGRTTMNVALRLAEDAGWKASAARQTYRDARGALWDVRFALRAADAQGAATAFERFLRRRAIARSVRHDAKEQLATARSYLEFYTEEKP